MSETVHYKGKLKPVAMGGNVEHVARRILGEKLIPIKGCYKNAMEQLEDESGGEYIELKGSIYTIEKQEVDITDDIMLAETGGCGEIYFEVKYYNGGACLHEAITCAVERMGE